MTDVVVVGLGAMGSAAAWQLARRGARVVGLDRWSPPHDRGSSHGDTRITREAIGEGDEYVPLVRRATAIFREVEAATGEDLLTVTGGLWISSRARQAETHVADFCANTVRAARRFGIAHELLDANAIRRQFPAFAVRDDETGYYEPGAGYLRPERCVAAQLRLAREAGAELREGERVVSVEDRGSHVSVTTERGRYEAAQAILSAGARVRGLLPAAIAGLLTVTRQLQHWFEVEGPVARFEAPAFPVFIWELQHSRRVIYGFPAVDGARGGVKVATEQYDDTLGDAALEAAGGPTPATAQEAGW
jgi:sarcosine oxidase